MAHTGAAAAVVFHFFSGRIWWHFSEHACNLMDVAVVFILAKRLNDRGK